MQTKVLFRRLLLVSITLGSIVASSRVLEKKSSEVSKTITPKIIYGTSANEVTVSNGIVTVDYNEFPLGNQLDNYDMSTATFIADGKAYSAKLKGVPERYRDPNCNQCSESAEYQMKYNYTIPGVDKLPEKFDFAVFGPSKVTEILSLKKKETKIDPKKLLANLKIKWVLGETFKGQEKLRIVHRKKSIQIIKKTETEPGKFEETVVKDFDVKNCKFSEYDPFVLVECYVKDPETVKMPDFQFPEAHFFIENEVPVVITCIESYVRPILAFKIGKLRFIVSDITTPKSSVTRINNVGGEGQAMSIESVRNWPR